MDKQFNGDRLKELREDKGFTQGILAQRLGVAIASVSRWEKGIDSPRPKRVIQLARIFKIPKEQFYIEAAPAAQGV